ncbi:MAG: cytochrome c biogenesis protein CcsA [Candidatus Sumerlaeia bacterium]|nr:cytochrome c biogenesis protein CcsA [Candidatus Sumerlaeia bacterium]
MPRKFLEALASLKLTVTLFALSMVLIFAGTLAQVDLGIWQTVDAYFRSPIAWISLQLFIPRQVLEAPISIPFPGGLTLGLLMVVNLLAAHALRFRLTKKRIGIITLHAGVIVLLLGEFVTAWMAEEGMMSIDVGGSSQYVEDIRTVEFAVVDPSDPDVDRVVVIPASKLKGKVRQGGRFTHEALPFEFEINRWIPNARLLRANEPTIANRGVGLDAVADELPQVRGVDGAMTDSPSAYVTLYREGENLGTWLLSADLIDAQAVDVDGKTYGIALRFKRTYKPYTLHLLEFRHDVFVGTQVPRNFSSRVRLVDPTRDTDREVVIWMNNPLRYAGATFYQASYKPDGTGTVLQVVRNPGAALPYIACILVGGGMTWHFLFVLVGFLKKQTSRDKKREPKEESSPAAHPAQRALPWVVGVLGLLIACSGLLRPDPRQEFDIETFATLPVSAGGRVKPMDSAARHVLAVASGRQVVHHEEGRMSATEFLLRLMALPETIRHLPIIRVDHPDVLALLHLRPEDGGRISLAKIEPHWTAVAEQAERALDVQSRRRDSFQRGVVQLYSRVNTVLAYSGMMEPYAIPPLGPDDEWSPFNEAFLASGLMRPDGHPMGEFDPASIHPAVAFYVTMMTAYSEQNPEDFNLAAGMYRDLLERDMGRVMGKARLEVHFNRGSLFTGAMGVYTLAFLILCMSMLLRMRRVGGGGRLAFLPEGLRVSATAFIWAAFLVHTAAIVMRIYLQERPPVTNLYSSAVFVGWASVLLGLLLERVYKLGIAAMGAASIGFSTLVVAHHLGSDGDTMEMMQAVLDSNFWLATHVITITLGYSATFLAGALGIIYIILGVFTRQLTPDRAKALTTMVYGTVCFALLLSFVGTVLGGIWADQSWGRFWGWDPKENGAALVVLLNAIILHGRWGGIIRQRGIMVLAVSGNIITAWSWFGTNMLGIGLHSYGFMESAVFWLLAFVASQLMVMAVGLIPLPGWKSQPRG